MLRYRYRSVALNPFRLLGLVLVFMSQVAGADLSTGLVAYYPFNGNANDASGNGNNGVLYGGIASTAGHDGVANGAYLFDGVDDYIKVANAPSLNPTNQLTIAFWIKVVNLPSAWYSIIYKGNLPSPDSDSCVAGRMYTIWLYTSSRFDITTAGDGQCHNVLYGNAINLSSQWQFMTAVIDRSAAHQLFLYANGVLQTQVADSYQQFTTNSGDLWIGKTTEQHPVHALFKGLIDEIRIYNRALSATEVQQLYNGTVPQFSLSITKTGSGTGTVTSTPTGINCGSDCSENYPLGTPVKLTAIPDTGSIFSGFSGDADCVDWQVSMHAAKTCVATFTTATRVYNNDFSTSAGAEWTNNTIATSNNEKFLGASASGFGPGTNTLSINNLPAHTHATVSFDLYIIRTWDGGGGPDNWQLTADAANLYFAQSKLSGRDILYSHSATNL